MHQAPFFPLPSPQNPFDKSHTILNLHKSRLKTSVSSPAHISSSCLTQRLMRTGLDYLVWLINSKCLLLFKCEAGIIWITLDSAAWRYHFWFVKLRRQNWWWFMKMFGRRAFSWHPPWKEPSLKSRVPISRPQRSSPPPPSLARKTH